MFVLLVHIPYVSVPFNYFIIMARSFEGTISYPYFE